MVEYQQYHLAQAENSYHCIIVRESESQSGEKPVISHWLKNIIE